MEKYQLQLDQVNASLAKDPQNATLQALKSKLEQLLSLQQQAASRNTLQNPTASASKPTQQQPSLQVGEQCQVFVRELSLWKPGRIISIDGTAYIVEMLSGDRKTCRLEAKHVRRPQTTGERAPAKKASSVVTTNAAAAVAATGVHKPAPTAVAKRKHQPKKELASAMEWKKFSQKLGKK